MWSGGGAALLVECRDRPASRAMLERQREARPWRLDLEQRPGSGDDGISGRLLAHGREARDGETLLSPGDLSWTSVEPPGPDVDLHGFDSDHRHCQAPSRRNRLVLCPSSGHSATGTSVRFWRHPDRTGVRCQEASDRILRPGRASLAVTGRGEAAGARRRPLLWPGVSQTPGSWLLEHVFHD